MVAGAAGSALLAEVVCVGTLVLLLLTGVIRLT
jgi:hypothetical protein